MVIFRKHEEEMLEFWEDIPVIRRYLQEHGELGIVSDRTLSILWKEFSSTYESGWLNPYEPLLENFAEWLDHRDVRVY